MTLRAIAVVGAGRVGLTLGRALSHGGHPVTMLTRGGQAISGGLVSTSSWSDALHASDVVIVAVPDDAIAATAGTLRGLDRISSHHVVLHCSGMHDRTALGALSDTGAALGSFHPLMTFTRAAGEPELLAATPAALEGDARAVAVARELAESMQMSPVVVLEGARKPAYHAGAVFAANYLVVLAHIAEQLANASGAGGAASALYLPLMQRALDNVRTDGALPALTGPVVRGDVGTIRSHLAALDAGQRALYIALAGEALGMARERGLDADTIDRIEAELR